MENNVHTWFEVYSGDLDATKKFYADVFGWTSQDMDMGSFVYPMLSNNEVPHSGIMNLNTPEMANVPPHWLVYFHTADIAASCAKVTGAGGQVMHGPMDVPGVGQIAIIQDNVGAVFALHQPVNPSE
jgi:hypothetical protein